MKKINKKLWFTLVEIMVWILIFSIVIIGWFKAYSWVLIWKIKLIESTDIQKQAFYFSEKFFEEIKKGWTIDYEEYFNRQVVWTATQSWHYKKNTWFWNFWIDWNIWTYSYWTWFYYCMSKNWTNMWTWGCVEDFNTTQASVKTKPQRYWQYAFQFIDYNSNADDDLWDEDSDGNIIGDDDDEVLGIWPGAFSGSEVKEIYLISADKKRRTLFRWRTFPDEGSGWLTRWTIEFLKLDWKDWWYKHDKTSSWAYDWIIDTWIINKDFSGWATVIAGSNNTNYWQPLFWDNINVENVKFFLYPNKDISRSWKDSDPQINISPYLRIKMTLSPSYNARKWFKWKIPKIQINTTINLTDIYSR